MLLPFSCWLSLLRLALLQCLKNLLQLFLEPCELNRADRLLGMQHDVQGQADCVQLTLHGCAHPPSYPISIYCIPQNLAHSKTYARAPIIVAQAIEGRYIPCKMFFALLVHSLKVRVSQQSRGLGELLPILFLVLVHIVACMQRRENCAGRLLAISGFNRDTLAPFGAPA